jgi:hypothetical protein
MYATPTFLASEGFPGWALPIAGGVLFSILWGCGSPLHSGFSAVPSRSAATRYAIEH